MSAATFVCLVVCAFVCCLLSPFPEDQDAEGEHGGEADAGQNADLQVFAGGLGDSADDCGTHRAAEIPGQRQQGKHGGAALGHDLGRDADGAGPHDAHGEAADHAADEAKHGQLCQRGEQIAAQAQDAGGDHEGSQFDLLPVGGIQNAREAHKDRESARTGQITDGFGYMQRGFREG